jgi:hypothetical protein
MRSTNEKSAGFCSEVAITFFKPWLRGLAHNSGFAHGGILSAIESKTFNFIDTLRKRCQFLCLICKL